MSTDVEKGHQALLEIEGGDSFEEFGGPTLSSGPRLRR